MHDTKQTVLRRGKRPAQLKAVAAEMPAPRKPIDEWMQEFIAACWRPDWPSTDACEWAMYAGMLRAEAEIAGYQSSELETHCDGDVANYVMQRKQAKYRLP